MHHLMLVTLSLADSNNSPAARNSAYNLLSNDDSFVGEGGRFGSPLADWFVIGGRWSGMLREALLGQPYRDALAKEFPEFTERFFTTNRVEQCKEGLEQLWQRFGGTGMHPLQRTGYDHYGDDDDAMPVDRFLYERFLKPHAGADRTIGDDTRADFADLDGNEVDESFIGSKWLVVVDYHN